MRKPRTYVLVVVDASTSMLGVAKGVRVGINAYVADLCEDTERDYRLSLVTFSEGYHPVCTAVEPAVVPKLTDVNYRPDGNTALMDAIGRTFADFDAVVPTLAATDLVLFVLATDGSENWSQHYDATQVLGLIRKREATGQWTFIHLAAGLDAAQTSHTIGLRHVVEIAKADFTRRDTYRGIGAATRAYADGLSSGDITALLDEALAGVGGRHP